MKAGLSIEELAAEIMRQNEIKEDYVVNSPCLQMDAWDSDLFLRVMDGQQTDRLEPLEISENAHRQISARLGIPIKYYNRMLAESPDLLIRPDLPLRSIPTGSAWSPPRKNRRIFMFAVPGNSLESGYRQSGLNRCWRPVKRLPGTIICF